MRMDDRSAENVVTSASHVNKVLSQSASRAAGWVQTEAFLDLCKSAVGLTGRVFHDHIGTNDESGVLVPGAVEIDGKPHSGCILALPNKVVFAWSTGFLRAKAHGSSFPKSEVRSAECDHFDGGPSIKAHQLITIEASEYWRFIVPDAILEGAMVNIAEYLRLYLVGAADFEDDAPDVGGRS